MSATAVAVSAAFLDLLKAAKKTPARAVIVAFILTAAGFIFQQHQYWNLCQAQTFEKRVDELTLAAISQRLERIEIDLKESRAESKSDNNELMRRIDRVLERTR